MAVVFDNQFLFTKLSFLRLSMSFYNATSYVISYMVILIGMISNWVTQSFVVLWLLIRNRNFLLVFCIFATVHIGAVKR